MKFLVFVTPPSIYNNVNRFYSNLKEMTKNPVDKALTAYNDLLSGIKVTLVFIKALWFRSRMGKS